MRVSARPWLSLCALLSACGGELSAALPESSAFECEAGPTIEFSPDSCVPQVEGVGGPKSVRLWTADPLEAKRWRQLHWTREGIPYLLGAPAGEGIEFARLSPGLELEWSRTLRSADGSTPVRRKAFDVGEKGVELIVETDEGAPRSWSTRVTETGVCDAAAEVSFGEHGHVDSVARDGDSVIMSGTDSSPEFEDVHYLQRRSLEGELLAELEYEDPYEARVESSLELRVIAPERYLLSYEAYSAFGEYSTYYPDFRFDAAWTLLVQSFGPKLPPSYPRGRDGQLYRLRPDDSGVLQDPPANPTSASLRPILPDSNAETTALELELREDLCTNIGLVVGEADELVGYCYLGDSLTIFGYAASGTIDWSAQLGCIGLDGPFLRGGYLDADGHLWLYGQHPQRGLFVLDVWL